MTNLQPKMSASYRAIFILSIFMVFFVLIAGAATNSKSSGFGVWIWGYTAWLMYKRRNAELVSFYKLLLWFDVIAACVAVGVLSFSDSEVTTVVGYSAIQALVLFVIVISLTYGLYKYFFNLESNPTSTERFNVSDSAIWNQVSEEVKSGKRIDSLWTRAFSESDGDSNKANALYIKLRFDQIKMDSMGSSSSSNVSSLPKETIKVKLTIFDFWDNFNTVGKLALICIILLVGYGIFGGNMDPYFQPKTTSKDNGGYSQSSNQPTSTTVVNPKNTNCIFVWSEPQRTFVKVDDDISDAVKFTNTIIVKIGKEAYFESLIVQLRKADAEKNELLAKSITKEIRANALTVYFEKNLSADFIKLIANEQNLRSRCL
jgi:hypothetical protein